MTRPLFVIGFVYLISTLFAYITEGTVSQAVGLCLIPLILLGLWLLKGDKRKFKIISVTALVAINLFNFHYIKHTLLAKELIGKVAKIDGEIIDFSANGVNSLYLLKADVKLDGKNYGKVKTLLFLDKEAELGPLDRVSCVVEFSKVKKSLFFNTTEYYKAKGVHLSATAVGEVTVKGNKNNIITKIKALNTYMKCNIHEMFPGYQGDLMKALILGDKSGLSRDCKDVFRRAGIYHILAVSGLHMSVVIQLICRLASRIGCGKKLSAGISIFCCLLFTVIVGPSPSVVRCAVMALIGLLGQIFDRDADPRNSMGLSVILLLLYNPYAVFDAGLQLSFLATWGIVSLGPIFSQKLLNLGLAKNVKETLVTSLAASAGTLPILLFRFNEIALIAPITNLLLAPIIPGIFTGTLIFAVVVPLLGHGFFCKLALLILGGVVTLFVDVARVFAMLPFIQVNALQIALCFFCVLVLWGLKFLKSRELIRLENTKKNRFVILLVFLFLILLSGCVEAWQKNREAKIFVLPGNGNVLISCGSQNVLIGGNRTKIYFNQLNWALDQVKCSQLSTFVCKAGEHSEELLEKVCENFDIQSILTRESMLATFENEESSHPTIHRLDEMEVIPLGNKGCIKMVEGVTVVEFDGTFTVIFDPQVNEELLSITEGVDNIILSRKIKLPKMNSSEKNIVIYDMKLASARDFSNNTFEVYITTSEKVLVLHLCQWQTKIT
ncbi:MAG: ComEC/Rec2 family competence protein [Oscillospiraceae bacterium]|jgi:competence protein ComEC|nr:ComEC/Rec2 family competence protein [Oscillospiraceae bacterium]